MAFQLTRLNVPNLTTDFSAETNAAAGLAKAIGGLPAEWRKQQESATQRQILGELGKDIQRGDFQSAASKAFALGDIQAGATISTLGQKAREQQREADWLKNNAGLFGGAAMGGGAAPLASLGTPNDVENAFVDAVKQAGLTNPVGLGAVAAYGRAESGFSPQNVNRTWSDPSESGKPGMSGGIMSWRGPRLEALNAFARERGEQAPTPQTQALFLAKEDPTLIPRLNAAKTPQEANRIMADAWRFAGYNRPGGENARREALTAQYAQRFGVQQAAPQGVQVAETEADVQRIEAQMPGYGGGPVQVAQAPAQPGGPVADMPAPDAAPAQSFAVPGATPAQTAAITADPQVRSFLRALDGAPDRFKPGIQKRLDLRIEELKQARGEETRAIDIDLKREQLAKARRENIGLLTPEQEAQKIRVARAGRPVNEPALPPGYKAIRDAEGNIERLEPIPGSKVAIEQEQIAEKKAKADILKSETGNIVANALDDIDRLSSSSILPVSGAVGARVAGIPGTAAHDVSKALETVGANISFQQLQQMREASPTGGALGNVTERELELLKNSFASLSQSQSSGQFKSNLGRVRATFERIVHGRSLSPQERKIGGPMTMERAMGLRDQAKQAIAAGAPADAVMKRLKEDYGISADGL